MVAGCDDPHSWAWVAPDGKFIEVPDHGTSALTHLDPVQQNRIRNSSRMQEVWKREGFVYPEAVDAMFEEGWLKGPPRGLSQKLVQTLTPELWAKALKLGLPHLSRGFWDPKKERLSRAEEVFLQDASESYDKVFQPRLVDLNSKMNARKAKLWNTAELHLTMRSLASRTLREDGWLMVSNAFALSWDKFPTQAQFDSFFLESLKCWKAMGMHLNPEKEEFSYAQGDTHTDITLLEAIDEFASRRVSDQLFEHFMGGKVEQRDFGTRIKDSEAAEAAQWDLDHPKPKRPPFFPPRVPTFPAKPAEARPYQRPLKKGDLSPPLGYPGGPCHVMQRIDDALNGPLEESLIEKVENADDLTNPEASRIYKPEADRGATGTMFKKLVLTPHAQYRMDLRSITIPQIRMTLKGFHDHYSKEKSRGSFAFKALESELQFTREIKWVDVKTGITVVFVAMSLGGEMTARIITCYRAGEDEEAIDRSQCGIFTGWAGDYEDSGHLFKPDAKKVLARFLSTHRVT